MQPQQATYNQSTVNPSMVLTVMLSGGPGPAPQLLMQQHCTIECSAGQGWELRFACGEGRILSVAVAVIVDGDIENTYININKYETKKR